MNATPTSCSSGRLRSTAARSAAGVAGVCADRCRPRRPARIVSWRRRLGASRRRSRAQRSSGGDAGQLRRRRSSSCAGVAPRRAGTLQAGAVCEQQAETSRHRPRAPLRATARHRPPPRRRIGTVLEQQPHGRRRADAAAGDDERRTAVLGSRVDVGAGVEQELHLAASGAAHISAVAPASFAALGSAPAASSRFTSTTSP